MAGIHQSYDAMIFTINKASALAGERRGWDSAEQVSYQEDFSFPLKAIFFSILSDYVFV